MSHNSKSARLHREARARKRAKQMPNGDIVPTGNVGPARTEPKHGKRKRTPANMRGADRPAGWAKAVLG
jgi:hypothetical protein